MEQSCIAIMLICSLHLGCLCATREEAVAQKQLFSTCRPTVKQETVWVMDLTQPLTSYTSYLRELYSSMSQSNTSQHWTHLPRCEFIQLAMIGSEGQ